MPIYVYRCESCENEHEAIQKFADEPLRQCPHCDKPDLKRVMAPGSFQLKGDGWYKDGYASKKTSKSASEH